MASGGLYEGCLNRVLGGKKPIAMKPSVKTIIQRLGTVSVPSIEEVREKSSSIGQSFGPGYHRSCLRLMQNSSGSRVSEGPRSVDFASIGSQLYFMLYIILRMIVPTDMKRICEEV
jgi:hypothetical protein